MIFLLKMHIREVHEQFNILTMYNQCTSERRQKLVFAPAGVITDATLISPQKEV